MADDKSFKELIKDSDWFTIDTFKTERMVIK